jgi:molybdenum cofactor synthesis domain-containing protein
MVSILLIGDEILSASVREDNLYRMLSGFEQIGYEVAEVRIVRDVVEEIAGAMRELRDRSEYLVTAGGIGPTHDDRTLEAASRAFSVPAERHAIMMEFLKTRYGEPLTPMVEKMADLPRGTEVIGCEQGRWPVIRWENVFILPGLPRALEDKMRRLMAMLPARGRAASAEVYLSVDESVFADWLTARQERLPAVVIGSYPVVGDYDHLSRVTVRGKDLDSVLTEARSIADHALALGWLVRVGGALLDAENAGRMGEMSPVPGSDPDRRAGTSRTPEEDGTAGFRPCGGGGGA